MLRLIVVQLPSSTLGYSRVSPQDAGLYAEGLSALLAGADFGVELCNSEELLKVLWCRQQVPEKRGGLYS
jgi:hypothetical protein